MGDILDTGRAFYYSSTLGLLTPSFLAPPPKSEPGVRTAVQQ